MYLDFRFTLCDGNRELKYATNSTLAKRALTYIFISKPVDYHTRRIYSERNRQKQGIPFMKKR